jgi:hypothetical protein
MENNILPADIIALVKEEGESLEFGLIQLNIFLRDGKPRWEITRSRSIINDTIPNDIDVAACLKIKGNEGTNNGL